MNLRRLSEIEETLPDLSCREAVDRLLDMLRRGLPLRDATFDAILPVELRRQSKVHWTPVSVARRAAELLASRAGTQVLDIGSGVGKFCLVGALTTSGSYVGIERRRELVRTATELVQAFRILDVTFVTGDMADLDWSPFDAIYLYNPFYENLVTLQDGETENPTDIARYNHYVDVVEAKLSLLRRGTRVVTYHGFGGEFPDRFEPVLCEEQGSAELELWVKS